MILSELGRRKFPLKIEKDQKDKLVEFVNWKLIVAKFDDGSRRYNLYKKKINF